ncbi:MAG: efflux transporter outer membrane subunit [Bradyrhizobiaceae bacterium]|nr:efflux transporter outer membrane subunit [Bradyrhizobiaceae bacterium]
MRLATAAAMAAMVCGCAVGPDFAPPKPPPDLAGYGPGTGWTRTAGAKVEDGEAQRVAKGRDIPGDWWRLFRSRGLGTLTDRALKNNADLAAAQAALRVAQANLAAGRSAYFPTITGNFSAERSVAPALPPLPDQNGNLVVAESPPFNLYTGQVMVSYTPDVFGGIRRNVESLQAQSDNQRFQLEATYLTLTSNIALAAIQEASMRGQVEATRELIKIASDILEVLGKQRKAGLISDVDVLPQEAALAQIEQTLPPLERQLEQQRHMLSALSGGLPSEQPPEKFTLATLKLPRDLPLSLPSQLVQQRPDIRAAEENLHAASAQIGVAIANRIPNVSLTGSLGSQAITAAQLFQPGTGQWDIAASVMQPIFDGGMLYQKEVAARATFEQATSQYRSTVIMAFQNVADTLTALAKDAVSLQKAVVAEESAERSLSLARKRLDAGDINSILLLNVQQTYFQAKLMRVQAQANRLADTVALFQALGGGWWNREDRDPPKHYPYFNFTE